MTVRRLLGRARSAMRRIAPARPIILLYHRVAELSHDPWGLAVTPAQFAGHLDYLLQRRCPMPLRIFAAALQDGSLPRNAVALTFDDGYFDNMLHALPALSSRGMNATLFVTTGNLDCPGAFWWDELARLVLQRRGPHRGEVPIGDATVSLTWEAEPVVTAWRAWQPPPSGRERAYVDAWSALRALPAPHRDEQMRVLRQMLGPVSAAADRNMTRAELKELVRHDVFDLGAHSVTHPMLTGLSNDELDREIRDSRSACEALLGRSVPGFSYPYGDVNQAVREAVVAGGFTWACSTRSAAVRRSRLDRYLLPRLGVGSWDAAQLDRAMEMAV